MNTLLLCLAVPVYILVGLLVVALVESADNPMSTPELCVCILLWPVIAAIIIAAEVLTLWIVVVAILISIVQQLTTKRKEIK